MTEAQFIKKFRQEYLEPKGWLVFKINERFTSGFPDLICIKDGIVRFIEVKKISGKLTKLQQHTLQKIAQSGSIAETIFFNDNGDWHILIVQKDGILTMEGIRNEKDYKNLGYMNGWWAEPVEYLKCCKAKHERYERKLGNCQRQVYCDTCQITWKVDSGD